MARFTTMQREQLQDILEHWNQTVDPAETKIQLAFRIESYLKRTNFENEEKEPHQLVMARINIAGLHIGAAMKDPNNSDRLPLMDFDEASLKQLALDLNYFPEEALQAYLYKKTGDYHTDANWEELTQEIRDLKADPLQILRDDLKKKLIEQIPRFKEVVEGLRDK